jgi:hypothetical protein
MGAILSPPISIKGAQKREEREWKGFLLCQLKNSYFKIKYLVFINNKKCVGGDWENGEFGLNCVL